jgi:chromosome segregation and condensation protein ScpB
MENLEMREIESAIEGILFASGEPVQIDRIFHVREGKVLSSQ